MLESLFELLFKYRPVVFEQGEFRFSLPAALWVVAALAAGAAAITLVTYVRVRGKAGTLDRAVLAALRLGALAIVLLCLLRPVLIVKAAVPQQNFLGVLVDDSRSMTIGDRNGEPRGAFVRRLLATDSPLLSALGDRFLLRMFRFSSSVDRLASPADLSFAGTETRLAQALTRAREDLAGLPLAGLVMMTDGADTTEPALADALLALKADRIPVFTVGVGQETIPKDIQIGRVGTPRSVLKGTSVAVDVMVAHRGFPDRTVTVDVESDGRIVGSADARLSRDDQPVTVRVRFTASEAGPTVFRFRVPPQPGETIAENNARDVLMDVEDRREKILYFEGEPRFEVKFIRRAVADDKNLQVVVLQRTAENKYLRLDVDSAEELPSGFPRTREELFSYRGLILGSVEAAAFTPDQLRMIADFVDRRGGGLLMLGGRRAFEDGGYAGTPVADVMPVVLEPGARTEDAVARLTVRPTRAGASSPMTQIEKTETESVARWGQLPAVTSVNAVRRAKPGATVLLTGTDQNGREQVVLAWQRYGRGKAGAFPVQDSWIWQLHASMPVTDPTHENFWRQLLRWLVNDVPDQVVVTTAADRVEPGQRVTLHAEVADSTYVEVNDARVVAHLTGPSGTPVEIPMPWTGQRNGEYEATFVPQAPGLHAARIEASRGGAPLGVDTSYVRASPGAEEYFDAGMRASLLERIAGETGGRFYTRDRVAALAEDLKYTGRGVTVAEERELWDMPALLLLFVGLVFGEWTYRRVRGLA